MMNLPENLKLSEQAMAPSINTVVLKTPTDLKYILYTVLSPSMAFAACLSTTFGTVALNEVWAGLLSAEVS